MSLKSRSVRGRSPPWRVSARRARLRVFPLLVASKAFPRSKGSFGTIIRRFVRRRRILLRHLGGNDKPPPSATADLTALSTCVARFVGRPFVGRAFFVRRAASLAGDLSLLFGRHRRETPPLFAFTCSHRVPPFKLPTDGQTTYGPF